MKQNQSLTEIIRMCGCKVSYCDSLVVYVMLKNKKQKVLKKNQEKFSSNNFRGILRKVLKFFMKNSLFITRLYEKRAYLKLKKRYSS